MIQTIQKLIDVHEPADSSEAESKQQTLRLLNTVSDPFSRNGYEPGHLTASALVLNPARDKALLIFHARLQLWLQPGGHFEAGEFDPAVAATREVLEETGLHTCGIDNTPRLLDLDVHTIPAGKREPLHRHFDLRLLLIAEENHVSAGDGIMAVNWFDRQQLSSMTLDSGLVRALKKVKLRNE